MLNSFEVTYLRACMWVPNRWSIIQVLVELAYCRLCPLLQVCMGLEFFLTIPKTFDDFGVISVICFAQDNLESNFTPMYEWLGTLESGCPNSEYWCALGLVLFVIGRCTHFDKLNCICHLSDHFSSSVKSVWRIWWSMFEFILRYIMLSSAKRRILDWTFHLCRWCTARRVFGPELSHVGHQM